MTLDISSSYPENLIILQILVQTEMDFIKLTPMGFIPQPNLPTDTFGLNYQTPVNLDMV